MSNEQEPVRIDPRVLFIQEYTLKSLRSKPDSWARMFSSDEQRRFITEFIEKGVGKILFTNQIIAVIAQIIHDYYTVRSVT